MSRAFCIAFGVLTLGYFGLWLYARIAGWCGIEEIPSGLVARLNLGLSLNLALTVAFGAHWRVSVLERKLRGRS